MAGERMLPFLLVLRIALVVRIFLYYFPASLLSRRGICMSLSPRAG